VNRLALVVLVLLLALAGAAGALPPNGPSPGVVVSQVYGGGGNTGAPYTNDFVELFNRGTAAVDVTGWSVQYTSAAGTGNLGSATNLLTPLSGTIAPGHYLLVQEAASTNGSPLPTPDVTDSTPINMSATAGKIALVSDSTGLGCNGGSTPCSDAQKARVVDLVGYGTGSSGANFFEGSAAAPTISNTTADFRAASGCTDTDDNAADFAAAAPAPRNSATAAVSCGALGPTPPSVAGAASPASVDQGASTLLIGKATPGTNPASTGLAVTGDLSAIGGAAAQPFFDDGTHGDATAGDGTFSFQAAVDPATAPGVKSLPLSVSDAQGRSGSGSIALTVTTPPLPAAIHDIQGAAHISPLLGKRVATSGIVTALRSNGFNLQDPSPDADPATSEGIFVFTSSAPAVSVGDAAQVTGVVAEFRPGGASGASNLTSTELDSPAVTVVSHGNPLPAPILIGPGGRVPPTEVIEDDATGDVETSGVFDPATDGIDFWESLEGMRVEIDDPVAVGPTNAFGETPVVSAAVASVRTPRGGVVVRPNDFNPERVVLDDGIVALPTVNVGDHYSGPLVGVLDYDFGNYFLEATQPVTAIHDGVVPETTAAAGPDQVEIATFNVENLAPSDPDSKFSRLAAILVHNMAAPDLVALEEVQDDSGATDNGVVAADVTIRKLIAAIQAAGGPTYDYRQIDPVNDQDGGQPGGNIRVVFLFRTDRGLAFVPGTPGDSTTPESVTPGGDLALNPGRVDPANPAWAASRKPLAGEFTFQGNKLFVIANHWVAKLPDDPLMGHVQPPQQPSEAQRVQQATAVRDFTRSILAASPAANVVVLGDLNDFQFSDALTTLDAAPVNDLIDTLPVNERYTYDYEGNSEVLDHILLSDSLFARPFAYDVVHVNSEFADQASDHDPQVVRLTLPRPATSLAVADASGTYGGAATLTATLTAGGSPLAGEPVAFTLNGASAGTATTDASGVATVTGVGLAGIGAGSYPGAVAASFAGDGTHAPSSGTAALTVAKAPLTVTADDTSRLFGAANPPLTATLSGFVAGESLATSGVTGAAACTTTATSFSPGGGYPITCTAGTLAAANYAFAAFVPGTLTVVYTGACLAGARSGPLVVHAGQAVCLGAGARLSGPLTVEAGGALDLEGAAVTGPVRATGPTVFRACGATVNGPLSVSGAAGLVLIGGDAATGPCAGNTITGPVDLEGNAGGVELNGNTVTAPVTIEGTTGTLPPPDTGSVHVAGNTVSGPVRIKP
jgi:predicted extracellular nuclease